MTIKKGDKVLVTTYTENSYFYETAIVIDILDTGDVLVLYIEGWNIGLKEYVDISQCSLYN